MVVVPGEIAIGQGLLTCGWTIHQRHRDFASKASRFAKCQSPLNDLHCIVCFSFTFTVRLRPGPIPQRACRKSNHTLGVFNSCDFVILIHVSFPWDSVHGQVQWECLWGRENERSSAGAQNWMELQDLLGRTGSYWLAFADRTPLGESRCCWKDRLGERETQYVLRSISWKNKLKSKWNDEGPGPIPRHYSGGTYFQHLS